MSALIKNILFALVLGLILWVGYEAFFSTDEGALLEGAVQPSSQASIDTQTFLIRLQQLNEVELKDDIFEDVRFRSLRDLRKDILDEPSGRPNPFAPIGQ